MKRPALGLCLLPLLAACGGLFGSHVPLATVYALADHPAPALRPVVPAVLLVPAPAAAPGLEGDKVVALLGDHRERAYGGMQWSAPVPELVQSLLVADLRARGGFAAVLTEASSFHARYLLSVEVREFNAVYPSGGGAPRVSVVLNGDVGRVLGHELIAVVAGRGSVQAAADRQRDVVDAFEQALAAALEELTSATHAACAANEAAASGP